MSAEQPQYLLARLEDALASRLGELDVHVKVVGDKVFLRGSVATGERRDTIGEVAREILPAHEIHNEVGVPARTEDPAPEALS